MKLKHAIDNEALKGEINFSPLSYDERLDISRKLLDISNNYKDEKALDGILQVAKLYADTVRSQVHSVDVVVVFDGEYKDHKIESIDELVIFQEGNDEVQALGRKLVNGIILGKQRLKDSEETAL